ncbi:MAG: CBS domain-containing protein [Salinigranum sp.]
MDISDAVTTEFRQFDPSTRVAKLRGAFDTDPRSRVLVIAGDEGFEGVVSRRRLLSSHHSPDERASSVMRSAPRVTRTEDVREVARLMVESELDLLPVFEGEDLFGVVTSRDLLEGVEPYLDALDVEDVFTRDLVFVQSETTVGEVISRFRTNGFSHLPVIDGDDVRGMISVYDLVDFTVRKNEREQGGSPDGFDEHGGEGSAETYHTHSGYGERAGFKARLLDVPARDVMSNPAATVEFDRPLDEAVDEMLEKNYSSLLVTTPDVAGAVGIVTTTDVLRALTWTDEDHIDVQVFGVDMLDDLDREGIAEAIEEIDDKYEEMTIIEANVNVHRHKEQLRGTPLLLVTIRLFTDRGQFSGSGEGYGARVAFDKATDVLERNVLDDKERAASEQVSEDKQERAEELLGWWIQP